VHVVVATPGRILDHMRRETIHLAGVMSVVLDEADEMLDMGFAEDLELILEALPETRQTALFSATLPPRIAGIAERHLREPERVLIPRDPAASGTAPKVRQACYIVPRAHKIAALGRVLDIEAPTLAIVFCRTRLEVAELAERLVGRGYSVEALHGGMTQAERDRVMKKARAASVDLLVATDVAARGIDIEHISHVVNFDVPSSPEAYTHRIGRTGRAGREGVAITLAEPREHRLVRNIEWITKSKIEIAVVPTAHDIKSHRLDLTKGALREVLAAAAAARQAGEAGELDGFRTVVEALAGEFDPMDVAAAAVKLAHEASAGDAAAEDDLHIPSYESFARPKHGAAGGAAGGARFDDRAAWTKDHAPHHAAGAARRDTSHAVPLEERPVYRRPVEGGGYESCGHEGRPSGGWSNEGRGGWRDEERGPRHGGRHEADLVRVYIAAGRRMGMRPADLVGAIANEAHVNPRGIGAIEIADGFSIVELPERDAERVIEALRGATLRGRRVTVRRDDGRARAR
jgi:ATP-dependent RNA helicase DeaD